MKRQIVALLGLLALTCWLAAAADIDGKWTAQVQGRGKGKGGGKITETLMLKASGNNLTGSLQGRRGAEEISDGTINGSDVSFKVKREFGDKKTITSQYKGTLSGGQLKLTVTGPRGGTRDVLFTKGGS
jgi:hypothetical protein